ncbi:dienelactone hydrolase family protein [Brachybacterium sp. AOP29-B2-41]|uniref:dienelactone hydrolase family protein n=1 Tax=Brachybacterium sp. AOP29-B2-41 TaxID=3457704 RepID=UPI004033ADD9
MTVVKEATYMRRSGTARNGGYLYELEDYFRRTLVDEYPARSSRLWERDYSGPEHYSKSVDTMRARWRELLAPPTLSPIGEPSIEEGWIDGVSSWWIRQPLEGGLSAQGGLAVPVGGATQLVIFQHGLGSVPERAFGVDDPERTYDEVALRLLEAGYAVLAPMNLSFVEQRNRAQRLARLGGRTVEGIEFSRLSQLLDTVQEHFGLDTSRVGFWGSSWGGMAVQFFSPLVERFAVGITSGFFNDRQNKMAVPDPRFGSFEKNNEEHAYLFGHLTVFGDADLASMVCPRPFMVQHGRLDAIAWWPQVVEEFDRAQIHWSNLGLGDRVNIDLHEGGHVVRAEPGVDWIGKWL